MKRPIAVQLYSLRDRAAQDLAGVLRDVAAAGYAGVETAGLYGKSAPEFRAMLDATGMKACSSHMAIPTRENIAEIVDAAKALGHNRVISGFGPGEFKTLDLIKASAEKYQAGAELLKPHGIELGYHNHYWEFDVVEGRYGFCWFFDLCPDVFSELDVYWCSNFGKVDVPLVLKQYKNTVKLLHIKDGPLVQNEPHTAVGAGKMNVPLVIRSAAKAAEWLIVELDSCGTDMTQAVRDSFTFLKKNRLGVGR